MLHRTHAARAQAPFFFVGQWIDVDALARAVPQPPGGAALGNVMLTALLVQIVSYPGGFVASAFLSVEDYNQPFASYRPLLAPGCESELPLLWLRYLGDAALRFTMALFFLLFCVPRGRSFFSAGATRGTMYAYIFHMQVARALHTRYTRAPEPLPPIPHPVPPGPKP